MFFSFSLFRGFIIIIIILFYLCIFLRNAKYYLQRVTNKHLDETFNIII